MLFSYLQVDNLAVVARVGGIGGEHQAVQRSSGRAAWGDGHGVFPTAPHDLGGIVKGIAAQGGIGNVGDGASLGQGDAQHLWGGRCASLPHQASGREHHSLRYAELHAQRHFLAILGFSGDCLLHIAVKGSGIHRGGELAAVDFDLGAVAVRLGILDFLACGFELNGSLLLPEFQRHHLRGAFEPRQRGQGK